MHARTLQDPFKVLKHALIRWAFININSNIAHTVVECIVRARYDMIFGNDTMKTRMMRDYELMWVSCGFRFFLHYFVCLFVYFFIQTGNIPKLNRVHNSN